MTDVSRPGSAQPECLPPPTASVVRVPSLSLSVGYSPRQVPIHEGHVQALMEVLDRLPPIVVRRQTMTVIDGAHRLEAARRCGRAQVPVVFFDGEEPDALALAVASNVAHGMPLTMSERRDAARFLLSRSPERSDRWIGHICCLSHSTVAKLRSAKAPEPEPETVAPATRVGRDGRRRASPRSAEGPAEGSAPDGGERAHPSLGNAAHGGPSGGSSPPVRLDHPAQAGPRPDPASLLGDPALRSVPGLGDLLDWLDRTAVGEEDMEPFVDRVPIGRLYALADECQQRARAWANMARALERRAQSPGLRALG